MEELRDSIIPVDDEHTRKPHSVRIRLSICISKDTVQPFIKVPDGTFKTMSQPLPRSQFEAISGRLIAFNEIMRQELSVEKFQGRLGYSRYGFLMDDMSIANSGK